MAARPPTLHDERTQETAKERSHYPASSMQIAGLGTRGSGTCGTGTAVLGHAELGQRFWDRRYRDNLFVFFNFL